MDWTTGKPSGTTGSLTDTRSLPAGSPRPVKTSSAVPSVTVGWKRKVRRVRSPGRVSVLADFAIRGREKRALFHGHRGSSDFFGFFALIG